MKVFELWEQPSLIKKSNTGELWICVCVVGGEDRPKTVLNSAIQHGSMSVVMQNVRNLFVFIFNSEVALWVFGKTRVKY